MYLRRQENIWKLASSFETPQLARLHCKKMRKMDVTKLSIHHKLMFYLDKKIQTQEIFLIPLLNQAV